MSKKSIIAGEYIIEIADNGHVDVNRTDGKAIEEKSTMKILKKIADKEGFAYEEKWNTQTMGSKLVGYLTAGKDAERENASKDDAPVKKYILELEAHTISISVVELENADDEQVQDGFEEEEAWTDIVKDTDNLYAKLDDMDENPDWFDDEDALNTLKEMRGEGRSRSTRYMADCNEDITIRVKDEDENEIATIDGSEVGMLQFEQGYDTPEDTEWDEDDEEEMAKKKLIEDNPEYASSDVLDIYMNEPNAWYWMNIQRCEMEENVTFEIEVKGDFDPSKLKLVTVLVEEMTKGMDSCEVVAGIYYDGQLAEPYDDGCAEEENGTNLIMKMDSDGEWPCKVYDFTNNDCVED